MSPLFLWYLPDLVDPASRPRPWAVWDGRALHWCAGEGDPMKAPSLFEAETIASLPEMLACGVRFNQEGMGRGNLYEGPMFALDKNKCAVRVGDAIKVAGHHTVVREIRHEGERYSEKTGALSKRLGLAVLSDDGDPECPDFHRNGASFISWDPAYRVTRLDTAPRPGMRAADRWDLARALGIEGDPPSWDALLTQVRVLRARAGADA